MKDNEKKAQDIIKKLCLLKTYEHEAKLIKDELDQAEMRGMERAISIAKNIPSISLGGDTYEIVSQVATAIRSQMKGK
jgi:hypothetical protein